MSKRMKRMKLMRKIVLILIILLAAYTTHVSAEVGDLLMSTSYKSLDVGESWNLEEGYALTIKQIDIEGNKIWLSLSKYNSEVDSKVLSNGETYAYGKEIGSKEYTILRATVGEIDKESRTARLDSVRQYSDGGIAAAPTTSTKADTVPMAQKTFPTSGSSGNIPKLIFPSNGDIMNDGRVGNIVWDFDWTDVEGASEYQLYVIGGPAAEVPLIDTITTSSYYRSIQSGVILSKNYYGWTAKVRAKVNGQWGEWSETRDFQVGRTPTAFQPTPVTTPQQIATARTPSTTRYATQVVTPATNIAQQSKTSNTTLIFGGAALLIVLVMLVGKSRTKGQKAPSPTSAPKPNSDAKRSQDESKAYLEWLMEINRLSVEVSKSRSEDPNKRAHMLHNANRELRELYDIREKALKEGSIIPSKDARLKEAKSIIQDAEVDMQDAIKKGVQIPQSVHRLLQDAQKEVDAGHIATAKEYASKCNEKVDAAVKDFMQRKAEQTRKQRELEQMRKGASERIKSANKSIEKAEWLGITIKHAKELNLKAQSAFDANDCSSAITYANQSTDAAKKLIDESKPSISIELPSKMEYDTWKHRDLTVTNAGTAHAVAITITFLTALEVRELGTIKKLGVGEQKTLNVNIRPTEKGEVPFDYSIGFKDLMDRDYKTKDTINLQIGTGAEEDRGRVGYESAELAIVRGYEDLPNNDIRFGIRITNNSNYLIADVETILDYPRTRFSLKGDKVQVLDNIHPNGERTAKYVLTPRSCIHNEAIGATIIYKDHTGKKRTAQMQPKEVHCVRPFLCENPMREGKFAELAAKSESIDEGLSFSGIGVSEIADFIKESCTYRLYVIGEHEHDGRTILYLAGESIGEKVYYLLTVVVGEYMGATQVMLRAYSDKSHGLRGFMNETTASLKQLIGSVQSAKEIGIIENKQVFTFINSVLNRTSVGGGVIQGGKTEVNIKDSIVNRSDVGGDAER